MSQLPYHLEAEQMLLAAIFADNQIFETIEFLKIQHFYLPVHQKIFQYIGELITIASVANPITIESLLSQSIINAKEYLVQIAAMPVSLYASVSYAKQIYEHYIRRQLIYLSEETALNARDFIKPVQDQIGQLEQKLFDIAMNTDNKQADTFHTSLNMAVTSAKVALGRDSHIIGCTTGLIDLDKCIGGLHNSDLLILAGRPSMGKTALAMNIGFNAAQAFVQGKPEGAKTLFFSLEMSSQQLAMRILGQESQIPSDKIRRGAISTKDFQLIEKIRDKIASVPLFVDDTPALTLPMLRSRVRKMKRQENIGLVIIDYLQLMCADAETRVQELSRLTRGLKALAKELNIPIIAASQLSRAVEQREDKQPQLSDLRESGSIEQDADIVIFIYREAYYVARKKPPEGNAKMDIWQQEMAKVHGQATLMVAKQRHGPIKNITVHFNEALTKFDNYSEY